MNNDQAQKEVYKSAIYERSSWDDKTIPPITVVIICISLCIIMVLFILFGSLREYVCTINNEKFSCEEMLIPATSVQHSNASKVENGITKYYNISTRCQCVPKNTQLEKH